MNLFPLNILMAVAWAALMGQFNFPTLVAGYVIGFAALWVAQPLYGRPSGYFKRNWRIVRLVGFFLYDLVISSIDVVWDVITPWDLSKPSIVKMPLDAKTDAEILLVTNLISLTPGTLSIDVTEDRKYLLVHAMFAEDEDALIHRLKSGMERMVLEVFET
ncbi:MAG: Na+/H+ antiporter subunit E [Mangrovicoccus sp.]|nr:Na+/H+ antiporter subunit E [Mangrovicoccus sp.]